MEPSSSGWLRVRGSSQRVSVQAMEDWRSRRSLPTMGSTLALLLEARLQEEQPTRRAAALEREWTVRPVLEQARPARERAAPPEHAQVQRHPQRQTVS
jgi:hypothetical protein